MLERLHNLSREQKKEKDEKQNPDKLDTVTEETDKNDCLQDDSQFCRPFAGLSGITSSPLRVSKGKKKLYILFYRLVDEVIESSKLENLLR